MDHSEGEIEEVKALKRKLEEIEGKHKKELKDQAGEFEGKLEAFKRNLDVKEENRDQEVEYEQQIRDLRRKIDDGEENVQEMDALKRKLEDQDKELESSKSKMKKQEHLLNKQDKFIQKLKDKLECPVCMDIPRDGPVPICPNGHFVCKKCKRDSCPTCRTGMGAGNSLLAETILENVEHKCKFDDCKENFLVGDIEKHEAVCSHRTVSCPYMICEEKVPLSELVDHLKHSVCCIENEAPLETLKEWNRRNYISDVDVELKDMNWPIHIHAFSDEVFAIFPVKSEGTFYFVPVMFTSEIECSQFKIELIVHERNSEALNSEMSAKFQGSPLSIDILKNDLKLYGTSEQLMAKIMKKSESNTAFSLSFKISKKIN